jgi:small-conductance mechanosensitive channel
MLEKIRSDKEFLVIYGAAEEAIGRILLIMAIVVGAHLAVIAVRALGTKILSALPRASFTKTRSLAGLATSFIIFGLYFTALGVVLNEFGVSLKAYLASASVLGLAIGFGSQGLVQDVVNGLTLIFADEVPYLAGAGQRAGNKSKVGDCAIAEAVGP